MSGPGARPLPADEIQLWLAATGPNSAPERDERLLALLSPDEREREARFQFARDRLQYLHAHALLRLVLSEYAPHPPETWTFVTNAHGKPALAGTGPGFNLSHTADLVVCAFAQDLELGVDVERRDRRIGTAALSERWLAEEEQGWLAGQPAAAQSDAFLRLWTLKEAYIKALGHGLSVPLTSFAVEIGTDAGVWLRRRSPVDTAAGWQLEQWRLEQHWLALAVPLNPGAAPWRIRHLDGGMLLARV